MNGVSRADVEFAGDPWDVNLSGSVELVAGNDYTVTFSARGTEGRALVAGIGEEDAPHHNHSVPLNLTDEWRTYTLHLNATDATNGASFSGATRVLFDMGSDVGQVDIDNVSVVTGHIGAENLTGTPTEDPTDPAVETEVGDLTLVFEDNFDDIGGQPNQDDWTFDIGYGQGGWGNGEAQYYTSSTENSHIVDVIAADASELDTDGTADGVNGALKIIANKTGNEITSARVKSDIDDLGAYGYYEVRAKLPSESGAWPAIWLLGDMTPDRPWPDTGEIDLVEWSSNYFDEVSGNRIISALHFRGAADQPQAHGGTHFKWEGDISSPVDEWHTYQVWWSPDEIKVGVDGNIDNAHLTYTKRPNATNDDWPFDHPMDIIMNIAIGGTLGGTVPAGDFTYEMLVDYVRVYQGDWTTGTGTDTGNDGDDNSGGTGATVYDSNDILHLGNADPGSAAKLTISKTGDDQLTVMMVSADANDPIDVITYGALPGGLPRRTSGLRMALATWTSAGLRAPCLRRPV